MKKTLQPAIFLDKDGTLIENVPYNVNPELVKFQPGAVQAISRLGAAGFLIVIVSNQSGIAKGYFKRRELIELRDALACRLAREAGVHLQGFQYCPHAPDSNGRPTCLCRKPRPGLLMEAATLYGIDLQNSWMIGDTLDDVEAGIRAGCATVLYDSGGETLWRQSPLRHPTMHAFQWTEVVRFILDQEEQGSPQVSVQKTLAALSGATE